MEENERVMTVLSGAAHCCFVRPDSQVRPSQEKLMNQILGKNHTRSRQQAMHIAFIQARWHADIVDECRKAFLDEINLRSNGAATVDIIDVPGAFEIPLLARRLARSGRYQAVVASAFVVDGGIYRHDFVASTVISGLMQAQLDADVPVLSAVLTPHHFHDGEEHRRFFLDHFKVKGREVAGACLSILTAHAQAA
jgi:6,7-dimethyl-8-ribityllumazine synthase